MKKINFNKIGEILTKKVLILLVFIGILMSSVTATEIFSDNFNDNDLDGWTTDGWSTSSVDAYEGYSARNVLSGEKYMEIGIDTSDYEDIIFEYQKRTNKIDRGEYIGIDWYDGNSWNELWSGSTKNKWASGSHELPVAAEDNADLKIRFRCNHNAGASEVCNVDLVTLSGTEATPPDTTPPGPVTGLNETNVTSDTITWAWTNPVDADFDHVEVWLEGAWEENITGESWQATGLDPETEYTITVYTVDTTGNKNNGTSDDATTEPDTTPPGPVTGLGETDVTLYTITWGWNNPSDSDFDHVEVWLEGAWQENITGESWQATGLDPDTEYTITVYTVDTTGNKNGGTSDSATTLACTQTCGMTLTSNTVLCKDLICNESQGQNVIDITAQITLDCNGHTIQGDDWNYDYVSDEDNLANFHRGIHIASNGDNSIIKNCNIKDFETGASIHAYAPGTQWINNTFEHNYIAWLNSLGSDDHIIRNNTFHSGTLGIYLGDGLITDAEGHQVYHNRFYNMIGYVIYYEGTGSNTFYTVVGGKNEGNFYDEINNFDMNDSDGNGYYDSGPEWPLNNSYTRIFGPAVEDPAPQVDDEDCGNTVCCRDWLTEDTTLTEDVYCDFGIGGLNIGADNVTLDCNNHKIVYTGDYRWGHGIRNTLASGAHANAIIKNCVVENFDQGIDLFRGGVNSIVEDNTVKNAKLYGIIAADVEGMQIKNNLIQNLSTFFEDDLPLPAGSSGIMIFNQQVNNGLIQGNTVDDFAGYGIALFGTKNHEIIGNTIQNARREQFSDGEYRAYGIHLDSSAGYDYNDVHDNEVYNNTLQNVYEGVRLENSTTINNTFHHNNFKSTTSNYINNLGGTNSFYIFTGSANEGNYYDDILTLDINDSDFDGYGDSGTAYPYSLANGGNVSSNVVDYGPAMQEL